MALRRCHCGHAARTHIDGIGLCLAKQCFCLIVQAREADLVKLTTGLESRDEEEGADYFDDTGGAWGDYKNAV